MGYFQVRYDSRVVNYDRRGFIRLVTVYRTPTEEGMITVRLVSSSTRLDLTKKENMLLFVSSEAVVSKILKLETSRTVILPPNGECSLLHGFECAFNQDTQKFTTNALNMHSVFSNGTFSS